MFASSRPTGLIVEDEWLLRMELADELREAGWAVLEAHSGEEALTLLQKQGDIAFLITDIRLGGPVDGWQVAEAFRAAQPSRPVIYVSANPDLTHRRVEGGVFLGKPCDMALLVKTCRRLLEG